MPSAMERIRLQWLCARQGRGCREVGPAPGRPAALEAVARQIRERRARAVLRAAGFHRQPRQRAR